MTDISAQTSAELARAGRVRDPVAVGLRIFANAMVLLCFAFVLNNFLNFWHDWPGLPGLFAHSGWFGFAPLREALSDEAVTRGWFQVALYLIPCLAAAAYVLMTPRRSMHADSERLSAFAAYMVRAVFWGVLLIGIADSMISFLRVEGLLASVVGEQLSKDLGRSAFRGNMVHYPLLAVSFVAALFTRSLGFHWLALLIVVAEIQIVIARFIFSYEQAFMGDLVRFWYGALFLFASAHTLIAEGHVRVDILYAGFSERGKAWTNTLGSVFLGLPLCWVILTMGMWGKSNVINGPLLNYEVTQSGYGMYVKYFLAGFLLIFAITMLVQFMSYLLSNAAVLRREADYHPDLSEHANV